MSFYSIKLQRPGHLQVSSNPRHPRVLVQQLEVYQVECALREAANKITLDSLPVVSLIWDLGPYLGPNSWALR